jgi:hypothetical protein
MTTFDLERFIDDVKRARREADDPRGPPLS